jgi:hypothetical protein
VPLKRDRKDHFGLASLPPLTQLMPNTSTGVPLGYRWSA